jgi:hypothetical protein
MSTVDDLVRLVPPPMTPVDADGDWGLVESSLGLRLPDDYEELVRRYGVGSFDDMVLWSPFDTSAHGGFNLVVQAHGLVDFHYALRSEYPEDFPYPLDPEPGGLLEWAGSGDGDYLCWLIEGEANNWPVIVWNIRKGTDRHDVGAVDLLYGYLSGQRPVQMLRPPPVAPWFEPYRVRRQVIVNMTEGRLPSAEQHQLLREFLSPTADRGAWEGYGDRQDHVKALDRDWLITHNTGRNGHSIWVYCPPEDADQVVGVMRQAAHIMQCRVLPH